MFSCRVVSLLLLTAALVLLAPASPATARVFEVNITDEGLSQDHLRLYKGVDTAVRFYNNRAEPMKMQSGSDCIFDGHFQCGFMMPGGGLCQIVVPTTPGTYPYFAFPALGDCSNLPKWQGSLTVVEPPYEDLVVPSGDTYYLPPGRHVFKNVNIGGTVYLRGNTEIIAWGNSHDGYIQESGVVFELDGFIRCDIKPGEYGLYGELPEITDPGVANGRNGYDCLSGGSAGSGHDGYDLKLVVYGTADIGGGIDLSGTDGRGGAGCEGGEDGHLCSVMSYCDDQCCADYCKGGNGGNGAGAGNGGQGGDGGDLTIICHGPLYLDGAELQTQGGDGGDGGAPCPGGSGWHNVRICYDDYFCGGHHDCDPTMIQNLLDSVEDGMDGTTHGSPGKGGDGGDIHIETVSLRGGTLRTSGGYGGSGRVSGSNVKGNTGTRGGNAGSVTIEALCSVDDPLIYARGGRGGDGSDSGPAFQDQDSFQCTVYPAGNGAPGGVGGNIYIRTAHLDDGSYFSTGGRGGDAGNSVSYCFCETWLGGNSPAPMAAAGSGGPGGSITLACATQGASWGTDSSGGSGGAAGETSEHVCPESDIVTYTGSPGADGAAGFVSEPVLSVDPIHVAIAAPSTITPDTNIDYQIIVTAAETTQTDVTVTTTLPPGTTFVSASGDYTRVRNQISWHFDEIDACVARYATLEVKVTDDLLVGDIIENQAEAETGGTSVTSSTVETEIALAGSMIILARDNPDPVAVESTITYTVKIYNGYNDDLKSTTLTASFPSTVTPRGSLSRDIPFIGVDEAVTETFIVDLNPGLSAGDVIEANFEAVNTDYGTPISVSDEERTPVGEFGIEVFEPWPTDPPTKDEYVTVRGYIRPSDPGADYTKVRLAFNVYSTNPYNLIEKLHSSYVNYTVNDQWEFSVDVKVGDLDNQIEIICDYDGGEVARRDDVYAQCEFFVWYYMLTKHLGWRDWQSTLTPFAQDFGNINADYESLTEAVYRFILIYRLNRKLVEDHFLPELGLLIDVLGDLVNPIEIITGCLTTGAKTMGSLIKECDNSKVASLVAVYEKTKDRVWNIKTNEYLNMTAGIDVAMPGNVQAVIAKQAFVDTPSSLKQMQGDAFYELATKLPFAKDDWFLENATAQFSGNDTGIKQFCSDVEKSFIGDSVLEMLDGIAQLQLEYMVGVARTQAQAGDKEGADQAYKLALETILDAYNSWSNQAFRKIATGTKWVSSQFKLVGLTTFGTGAATLWAGGSGVVLVTAGSTMISLGEDLEQASHIMRGTYLVKMFQVMLASYVEGTGGIVLGEPWSIWPIRSGSRGLTPTPDDTAVLAALNGLKLAVQTGAPSIISELDALIDAYDAYDATEAVTFGRAKIFLDSMPWQPDRTGFPEIIEKVNLYAFLRAAEGGNRAAIYLLAAGYETGESTAGELVGAIDLETGTYLPGMEAYHTQFSAIIGTNDIPPSLIITNAAFGDECIVDTASTFTVDVTNPGDEALENAVITLSTDYSGITIVPAEIEIAEVPAKGSAQASFQVTATNGFKHWGLHVQAGIDRFVYDEAPVNVDAMPASVSLEVDSAGATLDAADASLILPGPGFSPSAYVSLIPESMDTGPGMDYALVGDRAWRAAATRETARLSNLPSGSQLVINYGSTMPPGVVESSLGLYYLDPVSEAWQAVAGATQNTVANTFTGTIDKTGIYAVLAAREEGPKVSAGTKSGLVYLQWEDTHDSYKVYRLYNNGLVAKPAWTLARSTANTSYSDNQAFIENGHAYLYKVVGIDAQGNETRPLNIVSAVPHIQSVDLDGDGMPDQWEEACMLDSSRDDSQEDPDQDGLTNKEEYDCTGDLWQLEGYKAITPHPYLNDSDGGGEPDGAEVLAGRDPLDGRDDFVGSPAPSSIAGVVFQDDNGNGLQDGDEQGIAGVTVTLTPYSGAPQSCQTGTLGDYGFTGLDEGGYKVTASTAAPVAPFSTLTTKSLPLQLQLMAGQAVSDAFFGFMPPPEDGYELKVKLAGFGSGTVTSTPSWISCPFGCDFMMEAGRQVTLTATPDPQAVFDGWSGDCEGTGPCTLTMDGPHRVTASFTSPDSDNDGLPDSWERRWFDNSLAQNGSDDFDIDTLTNAEEFAKGLNPASYDTDGDGMADFYEVDNGLLPTKADADKDLDNDGFTNGFESEHGTDAGQASSYPVPSGAPTASDLSVQTNVNVQVTVTLNGSDSDGFPLTYSVTDQPVNGQLSGSGRELLYTPDADYRGQDSFRYKVNNTAYDSNSAEVTIQIGPLVLSPLMIILMN